MKFKKEERKKALEYEKYWAKQWKENGTFEQSIENRSKDNQYVFYDGPPFITGQPHHGTLLSSIVKDAIPRFQTMKGKRVERRWGWDCHGLPAEVFTEKKLGIKDKRDIGTKISLEKYITTCRANMVQTGSEWEDTIDRIGRWVDFNGAYKTMDNNYMESVWWAFKQLHEKGKIYEGERVLMYCTRDATPLAKAEIAMDNSYKTDTDPSVFVTFKLKDDDRSLLAWTTTPWTLPSNSAIAVNNDIEYSVVELNGDKLVIAKSLVAKVLTDEKHQPLDYKEICIIKGTELVGKSYEPLFEAEPELQSKNAFKIWHADFVTDTDGTGIAHESPAYGEEDYELARQNSIPWVMSTDESGIFTMGPWKGENVWDINKQIAKDMHSKEGDESWRGSVLKIDYIQHEYPHCFRCDTKLMYRAHPSWFMNVADQKDQMLEQNENINWFPKHIKNGRFQKTVESAPDWNISRDRFWATPMPVWKSDEGDVIVVGSYAELEQLSGKTLEDYHRPWIDDITFEKDGKSYKRIEKVMDCWFESGSMPFAQFHYPFENKEEFESKFPADFIVEYVGQVRAWFYYMHAVSVGLFGKSSFKNVITTGVVAGNDGRKMSKSFGNYTDPNELMDQFSADALRFTLLQSPVLNGEDFALIDKDVNDVNRKLAMIWNMYDFFTLYADVDGWEWSGATNDPINEVDSILDRWIISRLHQLQTSIDSGLEAYDVPDAMEDILPFLDDASNWFVRRSRKRFWKSEDDDDKNNAYKTLHYVLRTLAIILAPFTPFLSEELYSKVGGTGSVHLLDWPPIGDIDTDNINQMAEVRRVITEALAIRARAGIKVRQPLASVSITTELSLREEYTTIIAEEVNVKQVRVEPGASNVELDTTITDDLKLEGIARELIRSVQNFRKKSELQVDDRIDLSIRTQDKETAEAIVAHEELIMTETLAKSLSTHEKYEFESVVNCYTKEVIISLQVA